jgi:hypothetical protein
MIDTALCCCGGILCYLASYVRLICINMSRSAFLALLALTCATLARSQIIAIEVCSDDDCDDVCLSWTAQSGACTRCDKMGYRGPPCSANSPSSIVTKSSITYYSDDTCTNKMGVSELWCAPLGSPSDNLYLVMRPKEAQTSWTFNFR